MDIPKQLRREGFRFVKIVENKKVPIGNAWQKYGYKYNDAELEKHDGNYGIICGYGDLVIVDCDDLEVAEILEEKLPTFRVKTPNGNHFYYTCDVPEDAQNYYVLKKEGKSLGELRIRNCQCLIPPSRIDEKEYRVATPDDSIRKTTFLELREAIKNYLVFEPAQRGGVAEQEKGVNVDYLNLNRLTKRLIKEPISREELQKLGFSSRSERDQSIISALIRAGYESKIKAVFENYPCGEKYKEKGANGGAYLKHSIEKAKAYLKKHNIVVPAAPEDKEEHQVICLSKLMEKSLPNVEYFIEPFIPKNTVILLGGRAGVGKSLCDLMIGISIVSGRKFLNKYFVSQNKNVLIYDLENGERDIYWRTKYMLDGLEMTHKDIEGLSISYDFNKLDVASEFEFAKRFDVIILDSYRRFLKGDESVSEITDRFYRQFLKPLRKLGKTIIIIHHFRKTKPEDIGDEDIQDMFRGSTDLPAQVDIIYGITKGRERISEDGMITSFNINLSKGKNRLGLPIKDIVISVCKDDYYKKTTFQFKDYGYLDPNEGVMETIIEMLKRTGGMKRSSIIDILKKKIRISTPAIDRLLASMVNDEKIQKSRYGVYEASECDTNEQTTL